MSKSAKHRALARERLERMSATGSYAAPTIPRRDAPTTPQHTAAFDAAYSGHPITPEFAQWDDRGFMRWNGPVHTITQTPRRAYTPRVI
jgi:hypothetical protein